MLRWSDLTAYPTKQLDIEKKMDRLLLMNLPEETGLYA
jgi:hypothetical protein